MREKLTDEPRRRVNPNNLKYCSLCGNEYTGFGNNPEPLARHDQRCCDECNGILVVPTRIYQMSHGRDPRTVLSRAQRRALMAKLGNA